MSHLMKSTEIQNYKSLAYNQAHLNRINKIVSPLKKHLSIDSFFYIELFSGKDRSFFLSNQSVVIEKFLEIGGFSQAFYSALNQAKSNNYQSFVWPLKPKDAVGKMLQDYSLVNGITIIIKTESSIKTYAFISKAIDFQLANLHINEPELLFRYINYFNYHAKEMLSEREKYLASFKTQSTQKTINEFASIQRGIQNFRKDTQLKRYYLESSDIYFTPKEMQCLKYLIEGRSCKEIAKTLHRSTRTIEKHIISMKKKIGVSSKSALIKIIGKDIIRHSIS